MNTARGEVLIFDDPVQVAHAAAERFVRAAQAVLADREKFTVALAGGSTPRAMYEILATQFRNRVEWPRLEVFFGDERSVPPDHKDSNYRMAREALLDHVPLGADRVHRILAEKPPEDAARAYDQLVPHLDLVLLGMGPDGHTASLFPGTAALDVRDKKVVANHVPQLSTWRITLTYPAINDASQVLIVATGEEKAEALEKVFHSPPGTVPIQGIAPTSGQLTWMIDRKAASRLRL